MVKFSERVKDLSPSQAREILKLVSDPNVIALSGGSPAKESFEFDEIREITNEILSKDPNVILQYGVTEGWTPLREAYIEHIATPKGVKAEIDNVLITTGGSQGLSLAFSCFLNEGDVVLTESPTFLGTLMLFNYLRVKAIPVETDEKGIIPEDLEAKIKEYSPKMLYTIPTFQNPTGYTMIEERRKKVAAMASQYDIMVVEDDPYNDLRYKGEALLPIKHYDETDNIIMLNSMSKIISPGMRVGIAVAHPEIINKMTVAKQAADTHTTTLTQAICAEYLNRGLLPGHLARTAPMYKDRLNAMLDGIEKFFPEGTVYSKPEGGLFVWAVLPGEQNIREMFEKSIEQVKVAFVPGAPFFVNPADAGSSLRLNFSSNPPERITEGLEKLGGVIKANLK